MPLDSQGRCPGRPATPGHVTVGQRVGPTEFWSPEAMFALRALCLAVRLAGISFLLHPWHHVQGPAGLSELAPRCCGVTDLAAVTPPVFCGFCCLCPSGLGVSSKGTNVPGLYSRSHTVPLHNSNT